MKTIIERRLFSAVSDMPMASEYWRKEEYMFWTVAASCKRCIAAQGEYFEGDSNYYVKGLESHKNFTCNDNSIFFGFYEIYENRI